MLKKHTLPKFNGTSKQKLVSSLFCCDCFEALSPLFDEHTKKDPKKMPFEILDKLEIIFSFNFGSKELIEFNTSSVNEEIFSNKNCIIE